MDEMMPVEPKKYEPPICLRLTKEQVSGLTMGEKASFTVSGVISSMHSPSDMDSDGKFSVDLKDHSVSSIETNKADKDLSEMRGDERGKNEADLEMDHLKKYKKGK